MPESHDGPAHVPRSDSGASPDQGIASLQAEIEALRRERDELEAKLEQIAQVIGAPNADRILHDVRNVMNELVLLRSLADMD